MTMKLNPNLKERRWGFFFMFVFFIIGLFYLFYDGWLYEWVKYGYSGTNQHWDLIIFGDMNYEIINGEYVYHSTHNLMHFLYLCYWTAAVNYLYLITGNKWLKQGSIATMAFAMMAFFSTINPINARDIFSTDVFTFHSYYLQFVFDINHISGIIMGFYIFNSSIKEGEEINFKMITPFILGTWVIYLITKAVMIPGWPLSASDNIGGYYDTNQINNIPFKLYGFEYLLLVVPLLYLINFLVRFLTRKIKNPKMKAIVPYAIFASFTLFFVLINFIVLQNITYQQFLQT